MSREMAMPQAAPWGIALIAAFVLVERLIARGILVSRLAGGVLIVWGLFLATLGIRPI